MHFSIASEPTPKIKKFFDNYLDPRLPPLSDEARKLQNLTDYLNNNALPEELSEINTTVLQYNSQQLPKINTLRVLRRLQCITLIAGLCMGLIYLYRDVFVPREFTAQNAFQHTVLMLALGCMLAVSLVLFSKTASLQQEVQKNVANASLAKINEILSDADTECEYDPRLAYRLAESMTKICELLGLKSGPPNVALRSLLVDAMTLECQPRTPPNQRPRSKSCSDVSKHSNKSR